MQHSSHCVEMALLLHIVCIFTANVLQRYCKGVAASLQSDAVPLQTICSILAVFA